MRGPGRSVTNSCHVPYLFFRLPTRLTAKFAILTADLSEPPRFKTLFAIFAQAFRLRGVEAFFVNFFALFAFQGIARCLFLSYAP